VDDSLAIFNVSGIDLVRISDRVRSTGSADGGRVVDRWLDVDLGKRRTLKPKNLADRYRTGAFWITHAVNRFR